MFHNNDFAYYPQMNRELTLFIKDDYKQSEAESVTFQCCLFKKLKRNGKLVALDTSEFQHNYNFELQSHGKLQWSTDTDSGSKKWYQPFQNSIYDIMMQVQVVSTNQDIMKVIGCRDFKVHVQGCERDEHFMF